MHIIRSWDSPEAEQVKEIPPEGQKKKQEPKMLKMQGGDQEAWGERNMALL